MFQIRIHGRGGQGVVTAAAVLSVAAFLEGKHAQAFPSFGSERMGAPVVSFCRIDDKEIRLREPIAAPDALIVQDVTLFKAIDVLQGLKDGGYLLVNTNRSFADLHLDAIVAICAGGPKSGPIGRLPPRARFHWLTAKRSAIIQISPPHMGRCTDLEAVMDHLMRRMVLAPN